MTMVSESVFRYIVRVSVQDKTHFALLILFYTADATYTALFAHVQVNDRPTPEMPIVEPSTEIKLHLILHVFTIGKAIR